MTAESLSAMIEGDDEMRFVITNYRTKDCKTGLQECRAMRE